jgi:acetyl-CoA C-acetyltransferase
MPVLFGQRSGIATTLLTTSRRYSAYAIQDNGVYVCGFARTPIGKLSGALSSQTAPLLGSHVIKAVVERAGIEKTLIDEVFMGNVVSAGL